MPTVLEHFTSTGNQIFDEREKRFATIDTLEKVQTLQKELRAIARDTFGPYILSLCQGDDPPRVLKAGEVELPGIVIEKFLFEALPKFFVSCVLYRPAKMKGKCPALVMPVGHWWEGKATPMYQRLMRLLAGRGIICASFDSCGHGERVEWFSPTARDAMRQLRDSHPAGAPVPYPLADAACQGFMHANNVTSAHNLIGDPGYLCGAHLNAMTAMTGKRLIDLLIARRDVDSAKIGVCGASGGGTDSRMLAALDERVALAVPTSILGSNRSLSGGDCDQCFFFTLSRGISQVDLIACVAPRPLLFISASDDKHDSAAVAAFYRPFWNAFGKGENVAYGTGQGAHGFPHESRKIIAEFVLKHFRGETVSIPDAEHADDLPLFSMRELSTTFIGNVAMDGIGKGAVDLVRERAAALAKSRPALADADGALRTEVLRTLLESEEAFTAAPQNVLRSGNEINWEGEGGVALRCVCESGDAPAILFAYEKGVEGARSSSVYVALQSAKIPFGLLDIRGCGINSPETEYNGPFLAPLLAGKQAELARMALHQGRSLIGMRTVDLITAPRAIGHGSDQPLDLIVEGGLGLAAIFAAYLQPNAYRRVILFRTPVSCYELATATERMYSFAHFPFGILERFDLPDLTRAIPNDKLTWINPTNGSGKVLPLGAAMKVHRGAGVNWKQARVPSELIKALKSQA